MREKWTNLILHTTSLIHKNKKSLLSSHSFLAIFQILYILLLEIFLSVVSIPLYLVSKEVSSGSQKAYKIRRTLSLSILTTIFIVWLVKLLFVIIIPAFYNTQDVFLVSEVERRAQQEGETLVLRTVLNSRRSEDILKPEITDIFVTRDRTVIIEGSRQGGLPTIVNVGRLREDTTTQGILFFTIMPENNPNWELEIESESINFPTGKYWVQAMTYDETTNQQSQLSDLETFEIRESWQRRFSLVYLNYIVMFFLLLGILNIIFLI